MALLEWILVLLEWITDEFKMIMVVEALPDHVLPNYVQHTPVVTEQRSYNNRTTNLQQQTTILQHRSMVNFHIINKGSTTDILTIINSIQSLNKQD